MSSDGISQLKRAIGSLFKRRHGKMAKSGGATIPESNARLPQPPSNAVTAVPATTADDAAPAAFPDTRTPYARLEHAGRPDASAGRVELAATPPDQPTPTTKVADAKTAREDAAGRDVAGDLDARGRTPAHDGVPPDSPPVVMSATSGPLEDQPAFG